MECAQRRPQLSVAEKLDVDPAHTLMTWEEYMAFDTSPDVKYEFMPKTRQSAGGPILGRLVAMAGATFDHTSVKDNVAGELRERFKDADCQALTSDIKVRCENGRGAYPDVVVVCGPRETEPREDDKSPLVLLNPKVVVEVLLDSTEAADRGEKFEAYCGIESLEEYVLIPPDGRPVCRFLRTEAGWLLTRHDPRSGELPFESLGVSVPMAEVFRGVTLPEPIV